MDRKKLFFTPYAQICSKGVSSISEGRLTDKAKYWNGFVKLNGSLFGMQ
jgi:hypothetical protein